MIQAVLRQVVQAGQIFASTPERARCHPCKSRLEARLPLTMTRALGILARHVRDVGRALMPAGYSVERRNAFPRYAPVQTELTGFSRISITGPADSTPWLVNVDDPFERETRWLGHFQSEEE